jgi:hypothetical protein
MKSTKSNKTTQDKTNKCNKTKQIIIITRYPENGVLQDNTNTSTSVGFEVLTAMVMKSTIFWDITPCSPLNVNRRFGGTYYNSSPLSSLKDRHSLGVNILYFYILPSMIINNVHHWTNLPQRMMIFLISGVYRCFRAGR